MRNLFCFLAVMMAMCAYVSCKGPKAPCPCDSEAVDTLCVDTMAVDTVIVDAAD